MRKCPICRKGVLRKERVQERMYGVDLGEYDADVCSKCGETLFDEAAAKKMEARAKSAGIWGLGKKLKVAKSGNSLVIRIPPDLAKFLKLKAGTEVFVHPEGEEQFVVDIEG